MDFKQLLSKMENQIAQTTSEMAKIDISENVGGENGVSVVMSGNFEVKSLKISFTPKDEEDIKMLESMIVKALNGCNEQIAKRVKEITQNK
jgi:DNA-binding protein YbaB